MGYRIISLDDRLLVYNEDAKDISYINKVGASVSAKAGFVNIKDSTGDVVFSQTPSDINLPSVNGLYDVVTTIDSYIQDVAVGGQTLYGNVKLITKLSDFPTPVSTVIQLEDDTVYQVSGTIDIGANRLAMGSNTTVRGNSPALDTVTSSTTGSLITSSTNFRMFEIGFSASSGQIFNLSGSGSEICLMVGVRFFGGGGIGSVSNYDLFECNIGLFVGFTSGISFTGTNGTLALIDVEFFQTAGTPTSINLNGATWNIIRFLGCSFVTVTGGTGLTVAANGANLNSGYIGIIEGCTFAGTGTATSGYSPLDEEWAVSSTSVGIIPSDRIEPTGWGYYADAETAPATQALTTTLQKLQIDGGTTLNANLPASIRGTGELWDVVNDKITPISSGDTYDVRLDLEITATGGGASSLYIQYDIGGGAAPSNVVVDQVSTFGKTAPFTISPTTQLYNLTTFLTNGCQIFIRTDTGTATLATRGILITRKSSGSI